MYQFSNELRIYFYFMNQSIYLSIYIITSDYILTLILRWVGNLLKISWKRLPGKQHLDSCSCPGATLTLTWEDINGNELMSVDGGLNGWMGKGVDIH